MWQSWYESAHVCLWQRRRWHKHVVTLVRFLITGDSVLQCCGCEVLRNLAEESEERSASLAAAGAMAAVGPSSTTTILGEFSSLPHTLE